MITLLQILSYKQTYHIKSIKIYDKKVKINYIDGRCAYLNIYRFISFVKDGRNILEERQD